MTQLINFNCRIKTIREYTLLFYKMAENSSYVFTPMEDELMYDTFQERLKYFADKTPDKLRLVSYTKDNERRVLTCSEIYHQSVQFAKGLISLGIKRGDVIGIGLPNCPEWLICHCGIVMTGAISTGLVFVRKDGEDVIHTINKAGKCVAIIFDSGSEGQKIEIVKNFISKTDSAGKVLNSNIPSLRYAIHCGDYIDDFKMNFNTILRLGEENKDLEMPSVGSDDVCIHQLTSGTTGFSKLVSKTHFATMNQALCVNNVIQSGNDDVFFNPAPFYMIGGYPSLYLLHGSTIVTVENLLTLGSTSAMTKFTTDIINREKCTMAVILGPYLYDMMNSETDIGPQFPLKSVFTAGFPMKKSVAKVVGNVAQKFVTGYGNTEAGIVAMKEIFKYDDFSDYNCGTAVRGVEVKVVDTDGHVCPRDVTGVIHARTRFRFLGYVNDPEKTDEVSDNSGWQNLQDAGYISKDGEIFAMGRITDVILVGTVRVSPSLIEDSIEKHPEVEKAVVIAIEDEKIFQEPCACVKRKPGSSVTWNDIEKFLHDENIGEKGGFDSRKFCPKYHAFVESFPMSAMGKVATQELILQVLKQLEIKNT